MKTVFSKVTGLYIILISLTTCVQSATTNDLCGADRQYYSSFLELNLKGGNKRYLGRIGLVMPLYQSEGLLTYFTGIAMRDSSKSLEGNFGLGIRKIIGEHIYGLYGFYDVRHTNNDNTIKGGTAGIELLNANYEARINIYLPDESIQVKKLKSINRPLKFANVRAATIELHETALKGFDLEVGGNLPSFDRLQVFASYFYFTGKNTSKKVKGYRVRGDFRVTNWLKLDAEFSHDNERGRIGYGGISLNYAFDMNKYSSLSRLHRKMTAIPTRDIDIIVDEKIDTILHFERMDQPSDNLSNVSISSAATSEFGDYDDDYQNEQELRSTIRNKIFKDHHEYELPFLDDDHQDHESVVSIVNGLIDYAINHSESQELVYDDLDASNMDINCMTDSASDESRPVYTVYNDMNDSKTQVELSILTQEEAPPIPNDPPPVLPTNLPDDLQQAAQQQAEHQAQQQAAQQQAEYQAQQQAAQRLAQQHAAQQLAQQKDRLNRDETISLLISHSESHSSSDSANKPWNPWVKGIGALSVIAVLCTGVFKVYQFTNGQKEQSTTK